MNLRKSLNRSYTKEYLDTQVALIKKKKCNGRLEARKLVGSRTYDKLKSSGIIQKMFPEDKRKERPVIQKNLDGTVYKIWKSIKACIDGNGFSTKGGVWGALNKRRGHNRYNGFIWDYNDEKEGERGY